MLHLLCRIWNTAEAISRLGTRARYREENNKNAENRTSKSKKRADERLNG